MLHLLRTYQCTQTYLGSSSVIAEPVDISILDSQRIEHYVSIHLGFQEPPMRFRFAFQPSGYWLLLRSEVDLFESQPIRSQPVSRTYNTYNTSHLR